MKDTKRMALQVGLRPFELNEGRRNQAQKYKLTGDLDRLLLGAIETVDAVCYLGDIHLITADFAILDGKSNIEVIASFQSDFRFWGHLQSRQRYDKLYVQAISVPFLNFQRDSS